MDTEIKSAVYKEKVVSVTQSIIVLGKQKEQITT